MHQRICGRNITFLTARPPFCCFLRLLPLSSQVTYLLNGLYKDTLLWVVFFVIISWVNGQKYENLLQFSASWLASLRTWNYSRLWFSFSCSGYDLTLIKTSLTLNCRLVVDKCPSQFTAKTPKFRKSYLLFVTYVFLNN